MVEHLLQSKIPTAVYVYPIGGGAISAGVFVTLAGNIAAMSPGTTIGAATPVQGTGQSIEGDMKAKVENFAVSFAKAISEQRGRNFEWAEKAVREAQSITDREAIEKKVIDIIARDLDDLLIQMEGRVVNVDNKQVKLTGLKDAPRRSIDMTWKQSILNILTDPNILILLGLGALLGLGIEFYHPGMVFPGVVGIICLVLALTGAAVLPINYGGVALLLLAVAFFVAEVFVPSFGALGIAGIICLVLGAIYLVDTEMVWAVEGFTVDKLFIGSIAGIVGLILFGIGIAVIRSQTSEVKTGIEAMIGKTATVDVGFGEDEKYLRGKVSVMGEIWNARLEEDSKMQLKKGDQVKIVALEGGLTLVVRVA